MKTLEQGHWQNSGPFIDNFEQILHIILVFPSLALLK